MESEAFLLGHWKNFDELEEQLTLKELELVLDAWRKQRQDDQRFMASLQGINLDEDEGESTGDEVVRRAEAEISRQTGKVPGETPDDLATLGSQKDGFGIGLGLGYSTEL